MLVNLANFLIFFAYYLLIPTLPIYIVDNFHTSHSLAGIVISLYLFAAILIRPFFAYLADNLNRKTIYLVAFFAFSIFFAGYIFTASLALFALIRIFHGLAFGSAHTASYTVAVDVVSPERRGEGIAYFGISNTASMAVAPICALYIYKNYSFEIIFYAALIISCLGFISALFVKVPQIAKKSLKSSVFSLNKFIVLKAINIAAVFIFIAVPYGLIITYISYYGKHIGILDTSGNFFILFASAIIAARIFASIFISFKNVTSLVRFSASLIIVSMALLFFADKLPYQKAIFYISALISGMGFGISMPSFNYIFVQLASRKRRAAANSTFLTSLDIGIMLATITGGKITDIFGFSSIYMFGSATAFIALMFFIYLSKNNSTMIAFGNKTNAR